MECTLCGHIGRNVNKKPKTKCTWICCYWQCKLYIAVHVYDFLCQPCSKFFSDLHAAWCFSAQLFPTRKRNNCFSFNSFSRRKPRQYLLSLFTWHVNSTLASGYDGRGPIDAEIIASWPRFVLYVNIFSESHSNPSHDDNGWRSWHVITNTIKLVQCLDLWLYKCQVVLILWRICSEHYALDFNPWWIIYVHVKFPSSRIWA